MNRIPYFDSHCDTISLCKTTGAALRSNTGHIDLERAACFSSYGQIFAFYTDAATIPQERMLQNTRELYDLFRQELTANSDLLCHCRTAAEIQRCWNSGKIAAVLSIEGAEQLECSPDHLDLAEEWGVRLINLTWNHKNALSGTHCDCPEQGLTELGKTFVREAQRRKIRMDVSHLSETGFWDLVRMTESPIVASHSNSRQICNHSRNLTDDQFRAVCETGGVVGLNFYTEFVGDVPTMDGLVRHLEHFLNLGGERHIGLGGDLDGIDTPVSGIKGLEDVPKLWAALENRGYSRSLLEDIFRNNWLRIL